MDFCELKILPIEDDGGLRNGSAMMQDLLCAAIIKSEGKKTASCIYKIRKILDSVPEIKICYISPVKRG